MGAYIKYGKALLNILVAILTAIFFIFIVPKLIWYFSPFVIGFILSLIANPFVRFLEKRVKIVRKHGSMIMIIGVLALIVLVCYLIITKLSVELSGFINNLPDMYAKLSEDFTHIRANLEGLTKRLPKVLQVSFDGLSTSIGDFTGSMVSMMGGPTVHTLGNFAKNIPNVLVYTIMTILSSYFFITDREKLISLFKKHIPESIRHNMDLIWDNFIHVIGGYFKAQFKIMGVVIVILLIGFSVLGVEYAILLSILIAFLDFLPFFGTGTVLVPWAVIKLLSYDYKMAIGLTVIYLVSQLIRQVIQPKILGDTIGLDPLSTLFFMFIGYRVDGVFGMIISVPIGMVIIMLYKNGVFHNLIISIKILVKDMNEFRKFKK